MDHTLQAKTEINRNLMAVQVLNAIGFEHVSILKALPKLSGISHPFVAQRLGVSRQSVTHTMNFERTNADLRARIAAEYGIPVEIMFPDEAA
jgi:transcriptional regulator with XRE-family HTH domain